MKIRSYFLSIYLSPHLGESFVVCDWRFIGPNCFILLQFSISILPAKSVLLVHLSHTSRTKISAENITWFPWLRQSRWQVGIWRQKLQQLLSKTNRPDDNRCKITSPDSTSFIVPHHCHGYRPSSTWLQIARTSSVLELLLLRAVIAYYTFIQLHCYMSLSGNN